MSDKVTVEIPKIWLLTLAGHGNMGSGDIPKLMQTWAETVCRENGLEEQMLEAKAQHFKELRDRLSNTMGSDTLESIESRVGQMLSRLKNS